MRRLTPLDLKSEFTESSFRELLRPLLEGNRYAIQFKTVHRRRDGTTYPVEAHLSYHRENRLFLAVAIDVTERQAAEEKLRQVQDRYRRLAENAPDLHLPLSVRVRGRV